MIQVSEYGCVNIRVESKVAIRANDAIEIILRRNVKIGNENIIEDINVGVIWKESAPIGEMG